MRGVPLERVGSSPSTCRWPSNQATAAASGGSSSSTRIAARCVPVLGRPARWLWPPGPGCPPCREPAADRRIHQRVGDLRRYPAERGQQGEPHRPGCGAQIRRVRTYSASTPRLDQLLRGIGERVSRQPRRPHRGQLVDLLQQRLQPDLAGVGLSSASSPPRPAAALSPSSAFSRSAHSWPSRPVVSSQNRFSKVARGVGGSHQRHLLVHVPFGGLDQDVQMRHALPGAHGPCRPVRVFVRPLVEVSIAGLTHTRIAPILAVANYRSVHSGQLGTRCRPGRRRIRPCASASTWVRRWV
jgi:hypothetical protein